MVSVSLPETLQMAPFMAQEEFGSISKVARMSAAYITNEFRLTNSAPMQRNLPLDGMIVDVLHHARLPPCVVYFALYLLSLLRERFPNHVFSCGYRLFLISYIIASKVLVDGYFPNRTWSKVQSIFSFEEINEMERQMLAYLNWDVGFRLEDTVNFAVKVCRQFMD